MNREAIVDHRKEGGAPRLKPRGGLLMPRKNVCWRCGKEIPSRRKYCSSECHRAYRAYCKEKNPLVDSILHERSKSFKATKHLIRCQDAKDEIVKDMDGIVQAVKGRFARAVPKDWEAAERHLTDSAAFAQDGLNRGNAGLVDLKDLSKEGDNARAKLKVIQNLSEGHYIKILRLRKKYGIRGKPD